MIALGIVYVLVASITFEAARREWERGARGIAAGLALGGAAVGAVAVALFSTT